METKEVNETFLEIMSQFETDENECESSHCIEGRITCGRKAVASVSHRSCGRSPRKICVNALIYNTQFMAQGSGCIYCLGRLGYPVPARSCWVLTPL